MLDFLAFGAAVRCVMQASTWGNHPEQEHGKCYRTRQRSMIRENGQLLIVDDMVRVGVGLSILVDTTGQLHDNKEPS